VLVEDELVDCVWPAQRLVIELDSYGYHRSRRAFEDDRRRDTKLQLAGYRVVRLTRERLEHEPLRVIEDVRALVGSRPR
jgi:very-short-patch-repair endonuclease